MPLYEHVVISRQDLSNVQAEGLLEHFGKVLSENGGKVVDSEYWGLKTMAYKINKNRKGHYSFLKTGFSNLVEPVKLSDKDREDIEIEISNTTQIEKVLKLERKKKIIQEDKTFMRIKDMFDNTPIVK